MLLLRSNHSCLPMDLLRKGYSGSKCCHFYPKSRGSHCWKYDNMPVTKRSKSIICRIQSSSSIRAQNCHSSTYSSSSDTCRCFRFCSERSYK
ncbi:unnamed protein product [Schistosoma spindalis]|nr:unnamed protein product [Schistosoma spindale]